MKEVMLYFGSFNPVHKGHTAVAKYVVEHELHDELWFVVSPQNPLKPSASLAPDRDRLEMVRIAVEELGCGDRISVSDVEFDLPKPSYTIDTVNALMASNPEVRFSILTGADIMEQIERWKDYRKLMAMCSFFVYPRVGYGLSVHADEVTFLKDAPEWNYSSTEIRETYLAGGDISAMVSAEVLEYIRTHKLWI